MAIYGTDASETLYGTAASDISIFAYAGNDTVYGLGGDDIIDAGLGDDWVDGGLGNDTILGRDGVDVLWGDKGDDALWGESGDDRLYGESGNDALVGGLGNDLLVGGEGNDQLNGYGYGVTNDSQIDNLTGGAGADHFILGGSWGVSYLETGDGYAVIKDWDAIKDWIDVKGTASQYQLQFKSVSGIGSNAKDTEVYFIDGNGNKDRIGIVQDSINVSISRDFKFVA
ncbi:calcium-binding protein [Phormidium tenue FACHB-886]|nr:calcium-binding protein [Phormidium tenue FACHB-886]